MLTAYRYDQKAGGMDRNEIDIQRAAVSGNVYAALRAYVTTHDLGVAFPAGLFYLLWKDSVNAQMARVPDASFVRKARVAAVTDLTLPFPGAPDFALEVVSITEADVFTLDETRDYLRCGTDEVWVMYPLLRELHQYRRDDPRTIRVYTGDELPQSPLFPEFNVSVEALFRFP